MLGSSSLGPFAKAASGPRFDRALVHGGACLLARGKDLSEDHLLTLIEAHVVVLDAAPRHS